MITRTNELLVSLLDDPAWGISGQIETKRKGASGKAPLFVGNYLHSRNPQDIVLYKDQYRDCLSTLYDIDQCPSFAQTNRAYRVHASDNLIVAIDLEPTTASAIIEKFKKLPAHYCEYSMHNGLHMLYKLNARRLSSDARYLLANKTVVKHKDLGDPQTAIEYEIIFNDHWITLTNRLIETSPLALQDDAPDAIYDLIETHATKVRRVEYHAVQMRQKTSDYEDILRRFVSQNVLEDLKTLTPADFNDDHSVYEFTLSLKVIGSLKWRLSHPKPFDAYTLKTDPQAITPEDIILTTAHLLEDTIPFRQKHHSSLRDGLPWLMYVAKRAYESIGSETTPE